jgi:hypothetical protein
MKRIVLLLAVACWTRDARAQITVSGSPAQLTVKAAVAGLAPTAVSNSLTTYTVSAPVSPHSYTITAQINTTMPAGVTLDITLQSAGSGSSAGAVALTTTAKDVITGIRTKVTGATITYQLSATSAAGVVAVQTRRVTFTAITVP